MLGHIRHDLQKARMYTAATHTRTSASICKSYRGLLLLLLQEAIRRALEENPELAEQLGEAAMAKVGRGRRGCYSSGTTCACACACACAHGVLGSLYGVSQEAVHTLADSKSECCGQRLARRLTQHYVVSLLLAIGTAWA
jgi:hypothetical protein